MLLEVRHQHQFLCLPTQCPLGNTPCPFGKKVPGGLRSAHFFDQTQAKQIPHPLVCPVDLSLADVIEEEQVVQIEGSSQVPFRFRQEIHKSRVVYFSVEAEQDAVVVTAAIVGAGLAFQDHQAKHFVHTLAG